MKFVVRRPCTLPVTPHEVVAVVRQYMQASESHGIWRMSRQTIPARRVLTRGRQTRVASRNSQRTVSRPRLRDRTRRRRQYSIRRQLGRCTLGWISFASIFKGKRLLGEVWLRGGGSAEYGAGRCVVDGLPPGRVLHLPWRGVLRRKAAGLTKAGGIRCNSRGRPGRRSRENHSEPGRNGRRRHGEPARRASHCFHFVVAPAAFQNQVALQKALRPVVSGVTAFPLDEIPKAESWQHHRRLRGNSATERLVGEKEAPQAHST